VKPILLLCFAAVFALLHAQDADVKQRTRAVRDLAKQGEDAIPKIMPYVSDPDVGVRVEAVKALIQVGGPKTLDGLVRAAGDNDAEMQIRATDGLVNVYLPGYVKTGLSGHLSRVGSSVTGKFTDNNDQAIDPFVQVRPDVIVALGKLARGGASLDARANAARAAGVLRGRAAIPDLVEALRSKDDKVMYESLVAIQKIGDPEAAPRISFLLGDLEEKIQVQALETTGLLRNREAAPKVRDALEHARSVKVRRAALEALAMLVRAFAISAELAESARLARSGQCVSDRIGPRAAHPADHLRHAGYGYQGRENSVEHRAGAIRRQGQRSIARSALDGSRSGCGG
jgi:HEAT repeat protein